MYITKFLIMKTCWIAIGFLLCSYVSGAQQFIIRYDLAAEKITYFKVRKTGDTMAAPVIQLSRTNRVNLQLVNSPNSYQRRIQYIQKEETPETVIIPGMGSDPSKNLVSGLADIDLSELKSAEIFKRGGGNKDVEALFESSQQKTAKLEFTNQYNAFAKAYVQWQKAMLYEQNCRLLWKELAQLRYSLQYPAAEVKKVAISKTETIFPGAAENPSAILLHNNAANLMTSVASVKRSLTSLQLVYDSFRELEIKSPVADSLMENIKDEAALVNRKYDTGKEPDEVIDRIAELFRQILNDSYTQLTPLSINRKTILAEISFFPVIDSVTAFTLHMNPGDTIRRLVPIYKKEPLRFRNTFGFGFASFAESRWNYYVTQDSVIARESANQFKPLVVTYLHFYAPRDKGFRWGGTFGAGLPLSGSKDFHIMLGLSAFLGKNDPVCITAGIAGSELKKLTGIKLGDKVGFTELETKHYQSVYRLGYFLSLTFNPGSVNAKE